MSYYKALFLILINRVIFFSRTCFARLKKCSFLNAGFYCIYCVAELHNGSCLANKKRVLICSGSCLMPLLLFKLFCLLFLQQELKENKPLFPKYVHDQYAKRKYGNVRTVIHGKKFVLFYFWPCWYLLFHRAGIAHGTKQTVLCNLCCMTDGILIEQ